MSVSHDVTHVLKMLLYLHDLEGLGDVALLDLAQDARLETLEKGQVLRAEKCLDRHVYLIQGEVTLVADGKTMQTVKAGSERALLPVFRVHTRGLEARCVRAARLLILNEAKFAQYAPSLRPVQGYGIEVEEYSSTEQDSDFLEEIQRVFCHREVDLPSLPEVALKVNRAVQDEDADFHQIARMVQADPLIAARIVQVANSAMYAGVRQAESVPHAVFRIGLEATRAIVMAVTLKNLYVPKSKMVRRRMRAYYRHSIQVGAIAHALAARAPGFDAERAFLAGLIHDIGVVPLLIQADQRTDLSQDQEQLERVIEALAHSVGAMLLEQWGFEPEFARVAQHAEDWIRAVGAADYCDIVQVAQLHCVMLGGQQVDAPPMNELPAFKRLVLDEIDPIQVIEEARQEINEVIGLLAV